MDSRILAAVAAGGGLTSSAALRLRGVDARHLAALVRAGDLVAIRRGVYTTGDRWASWDDYRDRPLARVRAARMTLSGEPVFTHDSAALAHGLPLLDPRDSEVHTGRPDLRATTRKYGIVQHGARFGPDQVTSVIGLQVLDLPRTVADMARWHGYRAGLVAADGALQLGVSKGELVCAAAAMEGWPFAKTVRAVLADADPGAESAAETLARELLMEVGLGPIESQFPVRTSNGTAWADLRVGRHLFEVDGFAKTQPVAEGGLLERRTPAQALWDERKRQREICAPGLGMSRLIYEDFFGYKRAAAARRVLAEYAVTRERFGVDLPPEIEAYAAQRRGRRYRSAS